MTRLRAIGALILLTVGAALLYAQEQQRLQNIIVLARLELGAAVTAIFEGATNDAFETTLTVTDPTADRTLTIPDTTGHVVAAEDGVTVSGMRAGSVTLDGSNPTSVTTGLSVIVNCTVDQMAAATPNDDPIGFTLDTHAVAGRLDIYAFANASATDPTWVASTVSTVLMRWMCVGTP